MGLCIILTLYFNYFFHFKCINYFCKDSKKLLGQENVCVIAYVFSICPGKNPVLCGEAGLRNRLKTPCLSCSSLLIGGRGAAHAPVTLVREVLSSVTNSEKIIWQCREAEITSSCNGSI